MTVGVPAPGHITISVKRLVVRRAPGRRLPARIRPRRPPNSRYLPRTVRMLWGAGTIRRRTTVTYVMLFLVINRAPSRAFRPFPAARAATLPRDPSEAIYEALLLYTQTAGTLAEGAAASVYMNEKWPVLFGYSIAHSVVNADKASGQTLRDLFRGVNNGDNGIVFNPTGPGAGNSVETGHYDNGAIFGWTKRQERDAIYDLAGALRSGLDDVVADIERRLNDDVNGDGVKGTPPTTGETNTETTIGPPTVTGGGGP